MEIPPKVTAVAFDLDNTLIDRDAALVRMMVDWLSHVALRKRPIIDSILAYDDHGHADRTDFFRSLAEMNLIGGNRIGLQNRFRREFPRYFEPDPEVHRTLERLQKCGFTLALLSNGGSQLQREKLEAAGLAGFFDPERILISEEIGFAKPDRAAFDLLVVRLDRPADEILFVGDHFEKDILGAAAAGCRTCWVNPEPDGEETSSADCQIAHVTELAPE